MSEFLKTLAVLCGLAGMVGGIHPWAPDFDARQGAYALPVLWVVWGGSTATGFSALALVLDRIDRQQRGRRRPAEPPAGSQNALP